MQQIDNIIIGAGPGGYELAANLCKQGESVVIIERDLPGGTCLNRGCIPTKCLCATAATVEDIRRASEFGINTTEFSINYAKSIERMREVIAHLQEGVIAELSKATYIKGEARLLENRIVEVDNHRFQATKRLVLATGSCPAVLPIEGVDLAMTSDDVLADDTLPKSIIIIGGGVIGMEFASIFNSLGVDTTVVEFCKEILPPFEQEIAKRLRTILSRRGVNIVVGSAVSSIKQSKDGMLSVEYQGKRGSTEICAERVVMAVGRRPVIPEGTQEIGIKLSSKGFIAVDNSMATNIPGIYAIGDVNGLSMLAHSAIAQGRVIAENNNTLFNTNCIPSVVFTTPEVAMVGRTSTQLDNEGVVYRSIKRQFASNGKACAMGEGDGVVKLLVNESDDTILGITILGHGASDLIAEATMLIVNKVPVDKIASRYIHAHPTLSEIFAI